MFDELVGSVGSMDWFGSGLLDAQSFLFLSLFEELVDWLCYCSWWRSNVAGRMAGWSFRDLLIFLCSGLLHAMLVDLLVYFARSDLIDWWSCCLL